ncbi:hypothetical protein V144x_30430 [Gimesia aquarii]|uniref:Uncharacterized protein n=1 Tax=Gimesia aquarii TaxID=2527964 RepID=A0A517VX40_9PLAN|nr:hypothetical protein V144x_30430 [Gimesia aquarii]
MNIDIFFQEWRADEPDDHLLITAEMRTSEFGFLTNALRMRYFVVQLISLHCRQYHIKCPNVINTEGHYADFDTDELH